MAKKKFYKHVFVDTSIFFQYNFNYKSGLIGDVIDLARERKVNLIITDITVEEIKAKVRAEVEDSCSKVKGATAKARLLRTVIGNDIMAFSKKLDSDKLQKKAMSQLEQALERGKVQRIDTSKVSIKSVFDQYFKQEPPFGKGKKKSEFPDAFVIAALDNWSRAKKKRISIVSIDGDMEAACKKKSNMRFFGKLSEFLESVNIYYKEKLTEDLLSAFDLRRADIAKEIETEFSWQGFILHDQDGDVVGTTNVCVDIQDTHLTGIGATTAEFELAVLISFDAELSYTDPDSWIWDSEDKVAIYMDTIDETVSTSLDAVVNITASFGKDIETTFKVENITINGGEDIWVGSSCETSYY